jgi:cyclophilin family peptidyl-prolyl cis-trans isomerase
MNYKQISIIILIFCIIGGCSYFSWKYYFNPTISTISTIPLLLPSQSNKEEFITKPNIDYEDINTQPFFEITIGDEYVGRIVFQLFDDDAPKTCKNFRYLCSLGLINKDKPAYQDSIIHRVIKDFMIQGGDITKGDGTGGYSIYGDQFEDESFNLTHNQPGMLSMANSGPNTNNSQFFVTIKETPWLDNKHVVFGIIISGFDIIKRIELLDVNENDKPLQNVIISKCGLILP